MSLGLRLMLLNGLVLVLVLGAFAGVTYVTQRQSLQRSLDASLRDQARLIRTSPILSVERLRGRPRNLAFPGLPTFAAPDVFIQVTTPAGGLVDGTVRVFRENPVNPGQFDLVASDNNGVPGATAALRFDAPGNTAFYVLVEPVEQSCDVGRRG